MAKKKDKGEGKKQAADTPTDTAKFTEPDQFLDLWMGLPETFQYIRANSTFKNGHWKAKAGLLSDLAKQYFEKLDKLLPGWQEQLKVDEKTTPLVVSNEPLNIAPR